MIHQLVGIGVLVGLVAGCAARPHPVVRAAAKIPVRESRYVPPTTATMQAQLTALEQRLLGWGIVIHTVPKEEMAGRVGAAGRESPESPQEIWLEASLGVDARFDVLVHEAAHLFQPPGWTRGEREVFAELVLFEVAKHHGRNTIPWNAPYLANWKEYLHIVPWIQVDVAQATRILVGRSEPR